MLFTRARQTASAALVLVALILHPTHAQDAARGAALFAEARKAIGGEDKVAAIKRLQVSGTFLRSTGPDQIIDGDFDVFIELPDKYRKNELTGFAGANVDRTEALNGADVWDETAGGEAGGRPFGGGGGFGGGRGGDRGGRGGGGGFGGGRQGQAPNPAAGQREGGPQIDAERVKEQLRRVRQAELARLALVWLMTTDGAVAWIGTAESPDGTADVLEVRPANGVPTRLFLDTATHMPLMITWSGQAGPGRRSWKPRLRTTQRTARWRPRSGGGGSGTGDARAVHERLQGGQRHQAASSDYARHRRHDAGRAQDQELQDQSELQGRYVHPVTRAALVLVAVLATSPLLAQAPPPAAQAQLRVTVLDQTGAGIPAAQVTVTAQGTAPVNIAADERGLAAFPVLPIGAVQLHVDAPGFVSFDAPITLRRGANNADSDIEDRRLPGAGRRRRRGYAGDRKRGDVEGARRKRDRSTAGRSRRAPGRPRADGRRPRRGVPRERVHRGRLPNREDIRQIRFRTNSFAADNHDAGRVQIEIITRPNVRRGTGTSTRISATTR